MLPSDEALKRHWKGACWVADMWQQATQNVMVMKAMHGNGWIVEDNELRIDWDSRENMMDVRQRVLLLRKGCSCRRSSCTTVQCGCKRERHSCGAGCTCLNCCNLPASSREADTRAHIIGVFGTSATACSRQLIRCRAARRCSAASR